MKNNVPLEPDAAGAVVVSWKIKDPKHRRSETMFLYFGQYIISIYIMRRTMSMKNC